MERKRFYSVHKDFAQDSGSGVIYGHEEQYGLEDQEARALYHQLLAAVYSSGDPWSHVYINRDDGVQVFGETVDRRTDPVPDAEPETEG